eukprot:TRINITY_DN1818_c0_g1_i2.p1 TRINITY_DN1818_c0_g1~~TRINITY_DN1818_c0_g1_i2.p1  ORF type:complete len:139 (-),score=34.95 TRINITY_DN1818_c0_g1_i2:68-484(-)
MNKNKVCVLLLVFVFVALIVPSLSEEAKSKKLQIGVKHRPEECTRKTQKGDTLKIHYTGALEDGTEFDSSRKRDQPFSFKLGAGQVIKGWDQGLNGMCVGEKRKLKIPSDLGYGDRGHPPTIPGGATLIFDTELIAIE